jgi:hypothetical protein
LAPGVFITTMPRRVAASASMMSTTHARRAADYAQPRAFSMRASST